MTQKSLQDAVGPTGMSDAVATMMGLKSYSHGTTYNGGIAPTVTLTTGSSLVVLKTSFIPYQTQGGVWRMRFNIHIQFTSATYITFTINSVTVGTTYHQHFGAVQAPGGGTNVLFSFVGDTNIFQVFLPVSLPHALCSGDIELAAKPSWAF